MPSQTPTRRRVAGSWVSRWALNVAALCGALMLLATTLSWAFGVTPLVFRSGSMAPAVDTGGLGLAREVTASHIRPGDIITVPTESGSLVTHRVMSINDVPGSAVEVTLKGDANRVADVRPYVVESAPRVFWTVEHLGRIVVWSRSPQAMFVAGLLCALILPGVLRRRRPEAAGPARHRAAPGAGALDSARHKRVKRRSGTAVAALVVAGGVAAGGAHAVPVTWAAFTDAATATSGTFTASALNPPTKPTCTVVSGLGNQSLNIRWSAGTGPTPSRYILQYTGPGGTVTVDPATSPYTFPNAAAAGNYSVVVRSVVGTWTSADSTPMTFTKGTRVLGQLFVTYTCT